MTTFVNPLERAVDDLDSITMENTLDDIMEKEKIFIRLFRKKIDIYGVGSLMRIEPHLLNEYYGIMMHIYQQYKFINEDKTADPNKKQSAKDQMDIINEINQKLRNQGYVPPAMIGGSKRKTKRRSTKKRRSSKKKGRK